MKEILTVKQVAQLLKIHPHSVYRMVSNKTIPFVKIKGLGVRFDLADIEDWIQKGRVMPINWDDRVREWNL